MDIGPSMKGLSFRDEMVKRAFDLLVALVGLVVLGWLVLLAAIISTLETRQCGFFTQVRVGRYGRSFKVIKLRTMRADRGASTTVTTANDARITRFGRIFRKLKVDEIPQLVNVLIGQMSIVGPRPDVLGFADRLQGADRLMLTVKPGITGPATLKYRNEEKLLAEQDDSESFNRNVLFPDKVKINVEYVKSWSLAKDLQYIWKTITGALEF